MFGIVQFMGILLVYLQLLIGGLTVSKPRFRIRETFLPFAKPDVSQREIDSVSETIASGWWTTGPRVRQFEREFADYIGTKHAIAVNSATGAMHLALEAIGLEADDEVITTTYTFAATAEVIRYFDARPVLVDIDPNTFNIDPNLIEPCITKKTRAIIPVHVAGHSVDLEAIMFLAEKYGLYVIEDAAHALPTEYKGQKIGSVSDFSAFSFYATKTLATGEGGMITTDNDEWADRCQIMLLHGISKDAWKRYTSEGSWYYEIVAPGYKYNMTDIAASLGLVQLEKLERMNLRRQKIAEKYNSAFRDCFALQIPVCESYSTHSYHLYILRLNLEHLWITELEDA